MTKIPYIITSVCIVLAALFAVLNRVWTGFVYFVFASLLVLSLFWCGWLVFAYFTSFKLELNEEFKIFRAQKVNSQGISAEEFDSAEAEYRKMFNKKMLRTKLFKWFVILFCFASAMAFLTGMIMYR